MLDKDRLIVENVRLSQARVVDTINLTYEWFMDNIMTDAA